jgi:hypothetical protein
MYAAAVACHTRADRRTFCALVCSPHSGGDATLGRHGSVCRCFSVASSGARAACEITAARAHATQARSHIPAVRMCRQGRYALFGHSMGAWIVWEMLQEITRKGLPLPLHLFVSGNRWVYMPGCGELQPGLLCVFRTGQAVVVLYMWQQWLGTQWNSIGPLQALTRMVGHQ